MNIEPQMFFSASEPTDPVGVTLTEAARQHIILSLDDRNKGIGIRFGVTGAGCGGYSYVVEFVDEDSGDDHIFEQEGVKVFIDKKSILLIDGMEVDFVTNGFSSGLEFSNPLAVNCGCGISFSPMK